MKIHLQPFRLFILLFAWMAVSCDRIEVQDAINPSKGLISIAEAKSRAEIFLGKESNKTQIYSKHTFLWQRALVRQASNGFYYVQVELEDTQRKNVIYDRASKSFVKAPSLQALVFVDKDDETQIQVMELAPDEEYAATHQFIVIDSDFSGFQIIYSWTGQFIKGGQYLNGKKIGSLSVNPSGDSKSRVASCVYWYRQLLYVGCDTFNNQSAAVGTTIYYKATEPIPLPPLPHFSAPESYNMCYGPWQLNGPPTQFQVCDNNSDPNNPYNPYNPINPLNPSDLFNPNPNTGQLPLLELYNNKIGLYGPCPGLDSWQNLINFKPAPSINDKLSRLSNQPNFLPNAPYTPAIALDWYVQNIRNAAGTAINLDDFSVFMEDLPTVNGNRLSIGEFMNYVRLNINTFTAGSGTHFSTPGNTGENEAGIWQSNNPLGAVVSIAIPGDYGSVIVSEYYPGYESAAWVFSTIHDPWNGDHPVTGTRSFGIYETAGGYIFYTRGADRLTNYLQFLAGFASKAISGQEIQFTKADQLWQGFQNTLADYISSHGVSNVQVLTPIKRRPNWNSVKQALDNNLSLSTVPCN